MKVLKKILIAILALVVIALVIGFFSPRNVTLERSVTINASAASIFEEINSVKPMQKWGPWAKIDPDGTKYTFEGPASGVGSKVTWVSEHPDVGTGIQSIIESIDNQKVRTELYFGGFDEPSYADLIISADGEFSNVTWTFEGDMSNNPINKLFGLMMEGMLGPSYDEGLQNLKDLVEAKPTFTVDISVQNVQPITYLAINYSFDATEPASIGPKMGELYGKVGRFMVANNIQGTGMPFTVYKVVSDTIWVADVAIPCATDGVSTSGDIIAGATAGGKAVKGIHLGDYYKLDATHAEVLKYLKYKELEVAGNTYEIYVSDPGEEPDTTKWVTEVYYPIK
jgi:effector-binding domain-containing protein